MPDYSKSKIYKIWSPSHEDLGCYIGATTQSLHKRFYNHKKSMRDGNRICSCKEILCCDDVRIDLLEEYPCENKEQLSAKEGEWIRKENCVNIRVPGRTNKEWIEEHKASVVEYQAKYREENREKSREYHKEHYRRNRDRILERKREAYRNKRAIVL